MILTDAQAEERLSSPHNLANKIEHLRCGITGRTCTPIPEQDRRQIAVLDALGEKQKDIAVVFNTTQASVSNIANESEMQQHRTDAVAPIKEKALERLMSSLNLLTNDKLENAKAKELASVAVSMAKVSELGREVNDQSNVTVNIYAPQLREEHHFKTIEV